MDTLRIKQEVNLFCFFYIWVHHEHTEGQAGGELVSIIPGFTMNTLRVKQELEVNLFLLYLASPWTHWGSSRSWRWTCFYYTWLHHEHTEGQAGAGGELVSIIPGFTMNTLRVKQEVNLFLLYLASPWTHWGSSRSWRWTCFYYTWLHHEHTEGQAGAGGELVSIIPGFTMNTLRVKQELEVNLFLLYLGSPWTHWGSSRSWRWTCFYYTWVHHGHTEGQAGGELVFFLYLGSPWTHWGSSRRWTCFCLYLGSPWTHWGSSSVVTWEMEGNHLLEVSWHLLLFPLLSTCIFKGVVGKESSWRCWKREFLICS